MPLDLQIIRACEFIRLNSHDTLNFEASKQTLRNLAQACRKRGIDRALLDLRELAIPPKPIFKPSELAALVGTFREAGFTRNQRLAVLYRDDPHKGVRLFAFIGTLRGWKVRAFADFEKALFWLCEQQTPAREIGEEQIPIVGTEAPSNRRSIAPSAQPR